MFAGSVTTLGLRCSVCSGSVSWAATALAGTFLVLAAQWQWLLHVCRICFRCHVGCRVCCLSASSLQACSTVARAAACLQNQFKMQCWLQGMLHRSHLEFLVQARLQACYNVCRIIFRCSVGRRVCCSKVTLSS